MKKRVMFGESKPDANTLLLLHFDGNIKDSSPYNRQPKAVNAISYGQGKFDSAVCIGPDLSSYISYDRNWFIDLFNTGEYTIDFWYKFQPELGHWGSFCGIDNGTVDGFVCNAQYGNVVQYGRYNNQIIHYSDSTLADTKWHHIAFVSHLGTVTLYIDGVFKQSASIKSVSFPSMDFTIGGRTTGTSVPNGNYLDEFRISDVARWTSNFTPPTKPY